MRHAIKPPRDGEEEERFRLFRKDLGEQLAVAMTVRGITLSALSRSVYGSDKQTTLIRRTIDGEVDAHVVTLIRYAIALDCDISVSITPTSSSRDKSR